MQVFDYKKYLCERTKVSPNTYLVCFFKIKFVFLLYTKNGKTKKTFASNYFFTTCLKNYS